MKNILFFPKKQFGLYMKSVCCATVVQQGHLKRISANAFINTLINESFAHNILSLLKTPFLFSMTWSL